MGSSNMDVVTTGDIEAQRHNPVWFDDHKRMLRPNQEGGRDILGYSILKVPEYLRQPPQEFSPLAWRFGLHNRENLDSSGSEAVKLAIAVQYGLVGDKWDQFCDAIVDDPKAMLTCYGLQDGVTSWTDEQIKHVLALDALFLATYIDLQFPENERRLLEHNKFPSGFNVNNLSSGRYGIWFVIVQSDLHKVENQIPFVLIDKVVEYIICNFVAPVTSEDNNPLIGDLQNQQRNLEYAMKEVAGFFMAPSDEPSNIDNSSFFAEKMHILGATYEAICGSKGLLIKRGRRGANIHIPSATKLKQSGIKIVGVEGPLYTMSYKKKCLCLPKMRIFDATSSFVRNMAWYELITILDGCLFNDYISVMTDLIQGPEDLDLLVKDDVIYNTCGIKGFEMWIALAEGLAETASSETHHDMKVAIVSRCHLRRYRLWSEFKIVFCSKPWLVLSTIVVALVTMATLVQTYTSIIGSNKMKPKFP